MKPHRLENRRRALTLPELLIVIVIILLVSVVVLPTVLPALEHRELSEAARILQGCLVGARDKAIHDGQPSGIRLVLDPAWPVMRLASGQVDPSQTLACDRIVPIGPAPNYSEGMVSVFPGATYPAAIRTVNGYSGVPCLVIEAAPMSPDGLPNSPSSWFWNIRLGDRLQIGNAGPWYTVVGPMMLGPAQGNSEMFVNNGGPGSTLPVLAGGIPCEYLLLVNGRDDGAEAGGGATGPDGWTDSGFDGVDNNGNGTVDEAVEWELEQWIGAIGQRVSVPYTARRRPYPTSGSREIALPTSVVIDLSTWGSTRERSKLPVNPWTGEVEVLVQPDGTVVPTMIYSSPSSFGMDSAFDHFWLAERSDVGMPSGSATAPTLAAPKGEWRLLTLNARTGRLLVTDNPPINDPYSGAQQGAW